MGFRRGMRRLAIAALTLWEVFCLAGFANGLWAWYSNPFSKFSPMPEGQADHIFPFLYLAAIGPVLYFGIRWIVRGFKPE